jgi:trigger factor
MKSEASSLKTEILKQDGCAVSFSLEAFPETLVSFEDSTVDSFQQKARVKGFRPGKTPRNLVVRFYRDQIKKDVLSNALPELFREAFRKHELRPLTEPEIDKFAYELGNGLTLEAKVEVFPQFELGNYRGMKLERPAVTVNDKEVEEHIRQMAEYSAPFEEIADRGLQNEDFAIVDFEITDGETRVEHKQDFWVRTVTDSDDSYIRAFSKGIIGMKTGDHRTLDVTLPENYPAPHAGKPVRLDVTLKGIRVRKVPEIDDDYARKQGGDGIENLDQYRSRVRDFLSARKNGEADNAVSDQIAEQLLKNNRVDLPESLLKKRIQNNIQYRVSELRRRGVPDETINARSEEIFKNVHEQSVNQMKLEFIYGKIIEAENLEVSREEYRAALEREASRMGLDSRAFEKYLRENGKTGVLKQNALVEKVLNLIKEHSKIK